MSCGIMKITISIENWWVIKKSTYVTEKSNKNRISKMWNMIVNSKRNNDKNVELIYWSKIETQRDHFQTAHSEKSTNKQQLLALKDKRAS